VNDAAQQRLGYLREELLNMRFTDIDCGFGSLACARRIRELKSGGSMTLESYNRTKSGQVFPVELSLNYLELEGRGFVCCMSRDITERKQAERELSHQAQHDQLTGLPNRRFFETRLEHCIEAAQLTDSRIAVLYFDLDGFKLINDTHGHSFGDTLLKQCVRRVQSCVRDTDILARMGGDEFTLIATGIDSRDKAQIIAEQVLSTLSESFVVDGHELMVTASLGISLFPFDGANGNTLLRHADAAMYEAKREGKNRLRFFSPEMNAKICERLELENYLRRALERDELVLHYQPEISLRTNELVRNEALVRWNHPTLGLIDPGKFIPIAEETGLIIPIGNWVLEEACRQTKKLCDSGVRAGVGVNVSSVQFSRPDYVETVIDILRRTEMSPLLLELELTETVVMQGLDDAAAKIRELRTLGISVSIDDFGTGYSSLSYLQKLRIDNLKIDRSFIRDVPNDPDALALTRALVSLAHSLGMKVVVEGVETKQQLDAVRGIGGDIAQGFLLGRPAPMIIIPELVLAETA
jgi:diguanylate cyclase (GGDEF)-like protein/PAS domain S-box-containing protein